MITHGRNSALPAHRQVSHISVSGEPTAATAPSRSSHPATGATSMWEALPGVTTPLAWTNKQETPMGE